MTLQAIFCTSFKAEMLTGQHNILTNTIKLALYNSNATIGAATTVYTTSNEIVGVGYSAGGITATGANIWTDGTTVGFSFNSPIFGPMTVSDVRAGLFYNASVGNKAIGTIFFGTSQLCTNQSLFIAYGGNNTANGLFALI